MKPAEVRKQIAAGDTAPIYLLEGDDLQSRHDLALEFAGLVDEGLQAFNVESFYANEASNAAARDQLIGALLSTARTLPMMAPRRVVIVHEAERLLAPRRGKDDDDVLAATGLTLGRIRPEIDKLILYASGESTITVAHVREVVLPQEESEGTFALMEAVQHANASRALREISALIEGGVQPFVILGQLRAATIRLRPERVKNGLEAVLRTDVAIKSSAGTPQHLLECLA